MKLKCAWAAMAAAVVATLAASAATPPASETPQQFVTRLYATVYAHGGLQWKAFPGTPAGRKADAANQAAINAAFLDPTFAKIMSDNSTLAAKSGDEDLDYDPVCQCQDEGAHYAYVSGAQKGAYFDAVIKGEADQGQWTLVLTKTPRGWRIYDVLDQSGDIRARISKDNACMRAGKTEKAREACIG